MSLRGRLSRLDSGLSDAGFTHESRIIGAGSARQALLDDLRARIQAALGRGGRCGAIPSTDVQPAGEPRDDLPFVAEETSSGPLHVRTKRLALGHRTGLAPIAGAWDASADVLALLALDPSLAGCDPRRALFLDTETTGLSGGTGTVAFLVGLGWWEPVGTGGALVLEQLLVRALGEEAPMLERVRDRVAQASMLVTFNGKAFDMPLLRTRYVMTRVAPAAEPPHLDLLHVARRVHRDRAKQVPQACRLTALERDVLGFERIDDVVSADIGEHYMHFLRTGDARGLLGVVEHNAWDVVAMAALLGVYGEPDHGGLAADHLVGIARTLRRAGALDRAMAAAEAAVQRDVSAASLRARADIAKARGDRGRALADFEALAGQVDDPGVRLELAKIYEHWMKRPDEALRWTTLGTGETPERSRLRAQRLAVKTLRHRALPLAEPVSPKRRRTTRR
jgi:uncharacterized protein YprB with RNaseH-like and TPR domain